MERKMELVINKFSSHQEAELADEDLWRKYSYTERLDEWARLFNMYFKFKGVTTQGIKKVVTKRKGHAF